MQINSRYLPEGAKARLGKDAINDIQFSPDGTQMAVARGTSILIYNTSTWEEASLLTGHTAPVNSIVYRPDGRTLISYGRDGTLRLWDLTKGKQKITLYDITETSNYCEAASINLGGQLFAYFRRGRIELWDIETFTLNKTLDLSSNEGHGFYDAVFSPNGYMLAISGHADDRNTRDGETLVYLYDVLTGSDLKYITKSVGDISMIFSPDGCLLAIGRGYRNYGHESIELWDITIETQIKTFTEYEGDVHILTFSPNGHILAAGCYETLLGGAITSTIYLWDVATGSQLKTFTGYVPYLNTFRWHTGKISSMCFSPDGCTLASGCNDGIIMLWEVVPETNKTILEAEKTQFNIDEINAMAQQIAYEEEQYLIENGQSIETSKVVEQSMNKLALFDTFNDGKGIKTTADTYVYEEDSNEIIYQRSYQIQQFCEERGIETLCHFTRIENLHRILQEGLIGQSFLEEQKQVFLWNDADRADQCPEANCLSISFPNYQMFYSIRERMKSEGVNDSQWVVLLLDARVLWELDCAFCQRNAASNAVRSIPLNERKKPEALKGMFADFYGIKHQNWQIPQNYSTHPQAEVLVFNEIPTEYINAVHFWDATILEQWRSNYTGPLSNKFFVDRKYFDARSDYEVWRPDKFNNDGIPLSFFKDDNDETQVDDAAQALLDALFPVDSDNADANDKDELDDIPI